MNVNQDIWPTTSVKVWFSSITSTTWLECGTPVADVGLAWVAPPGAGVCGPPPHAASNRMDANAASAANCETRSCDLKLANRGLRLEDGWTRIAPPDYLAEVSGRPEPELRKGAKTCGL